MKSHTQNRNAQKRKSVGGRSYKNKFTNRKQTN